MLSAAIMISALRVNKEKGALKTCHSFNIYEALITTTADDILIFFLYFFFEKVS